MIRTFGAEFRDSFGTLLSLRSRERELKKAGDSSTGKSGEEGAVAPSEVAVFLEEEVGALLVDVADHGLHRVPFIFEEFHDGFREFTFRELGEGAKEEEVHAMSAPRLGAAARHDGEGGKNGGSEGEDSENEEGEGGIGGVHLAKDDGQDDEGGGNEDARFLIRRGTELHLMMLNRTQNLNSLGNLRRRRMVGHGESLD